MPRSLCSRRDEETTHRSGPARSVRWDRLALFPGHSARRLLEATGTRHVHRVYQPPLAM